MARILLVLIVMLGVPALAEERRLVVLHRGLLSTEAEISPSFDYTVPRTRRWVVEGDPTLLGLLGSGTRVRLRGDFAGDRVRLSGPLGSRPTALPVTGQELWRGRMQATVVSSDPPTVLLDGKISARLALETPEEEAAWQQFSALAQFTLTGNYVDGTLYDPLFAQTDPPMAQAGPVRVICQLSETFLNRCLQAFLATHKKQLSWSDPSQSTRFEVSRIGATLLDCGPGQLRFFGLVKGAVFFQGKSLGETEGEWGVVVEPRFSRGQLRVELVPNTLEMRLIRPLHLPVPPGWTAGLQTILAQQLGTGVSLPVPGAYAPDLDRSGILSSSDQLGVWTVPTGDRRTGFLSVAGPVVEQASGPNLLANRLNGHEFVVALSPEAVNTALERNVPGLLPIKRPIPKNLRMSQQVLLFKLEVTDVILTSLSLRYENGLFRILDSVVNVHWKLAGLFQGDEPGARLQGTATLLSGQGGHIRLKPNIESLEFLSPHILERSLPEQEAIRTRTLAGLSVLELDFLLPNRLPVRELLRSLELVDVVALSDELRLLGRLSEK
ncbi:MAG: hypothetical protein AMXMBFR33_10350 [Candidatus Xenobia bacterium]